jgi:hypothetical protein
MESEKSGPASVPRPVGKSPDLGAPYKGARGASAMDQLAAEVAMQHAVTGQPLATVPSAVAWPRVSVIDSRLFGRLHQVLIAIRNDDVREIASAVTEAMFDLVSLAVECGLPLAQLWAACSDSRQHYVPDSSSSFPDGSCPVKPSDTYRRPAYDRIIALAKDRNYYGDLAAELQAKVNAATAHSQPIHSSWKCDNCGVHNSYDSVYCMNCGHLCI